MLQIAILFYFLSYRNVHTYVRNNFFSLNRMYYPWPARPIYLRFQEVSSQINFIYNIAKVICSTRSVIQIIQILSFLVFGNNNIFRHL